MLLPLIKNYVKEGVVPSCQRCCNCIDYWQVVDQIVADRMATVGDFFLSGYITCHSGHSISHTLV